MILTNLSTEQMLSTNIEPCFGFFERAKGLLGRTSLPVNHCLWIKPCNNIHTLFMSFSIDIIFVNQHLEVVAQKRALKPWAPLIFQWNANSVFEFMHDNQRPQWVNKGDQLNVDP